MAIRDGSTHVVLDPLNLIERLAALIPAPRKKLVSYHGVFAPAFPLRHTVVPPPPEAAVSQPQVEHTDQRRTCSHPAPATTTTPDTTPLPVKPRPKPRPRYPWAELLRRVYLVDVLTCPHCKRSRRLLAFITDPDAIASILRHLGLVAPARPPPATALPF